LIGPAKIERSLSRPEGAARHPAAAGTKRRKGLAPPLTVLDDPHEGTWAATDESA